VKFLFLPWEKFHFHYLLRWKSVHYKYYKLFNMFVTFNITYKLVTSPYIFNYMYFFFFFKVDIVFSLPLEYWIRKIVFTKYLIRSEPFYRCLFFFTKMLLLGEIYVGWYGIHTCWIRKCEINIYFCLSIYQEIKKQGHNDC
jgi:hypothetical protein